MLEDRKIQALRSKFTIDIRYQSEDNIPMVKLSNCWKFVAITLDEALDQCLLCILKKAYKDDVDVKKDYSEGLRKLHELEGQ